MKKKSVYLNAFNLQHTDEEVASALIKDGILVITSLPIETEFPFSSLVLSANLDMFSDGCLLLEAQVGAGDEWSRFYKLGLLSDLFKQSFPPQADSWGRVFVDELRLKRPANKFRYRLCIEGDVSLRLLASCGLREPFEYEEKKAARLPAGSLNIPIWPISQKEQPWEEKNRICSPVSLYMALHALGRPVGLRSTMHEVYDPSANIFGNWVFNTAFAAEQGTESFVRRFSSLTELKKYCTKKSLVVASIAYKAGELPNAAQPQTKGHLVVIHGWKKGRVLVADPAAPTASEVLREYDAKSFARAWLHNKGGAAYVIQIP